jgi:Domain of unknown function (DUF4293)
MIQRVQSLYLLIIAAIAMFLLFLNPKYAVFKNEQTQKSAKLGYTTTVMADAAEEKEVPKWINSLMLISIGAGSVFAIFLFKKRDLQKRICIYLTLISALLIIFMVLDYNTMKMQFEGSSTYPGIWSIFPVAFIIFGFLAWRGIRKDEDLLKSMDRIR